MAEKERALDVFGLLSRIDRKDYEIWDTLSDEQKKEFSPLIVMRWMAGMTDPAQLIFLNEIVNTSVFQLGEQHKEFLMKLLAVCSNGGPKKYSWVSYNVGGKKKGRAAALIAERYGMTPREAEDSARLFSADEIVALAEECGLQKDEIAAIKKELK